jgi:hypothetical protein
MTAGALGPVPPARRAARSRARLAALVIAAAVAIVFIAANAHLIVVSFASQPECVLPASTAGGAAYRAATSSC